MFTQLGQPQTQPAQKAQLTQLLSSPLSQTMQLLPQITAQSISKIVPNLHSQNFPEWFELCVRLFSIQDVFDYANGIEGEIGISKLVDGVGELDLDLKHESVGRVMGKYSSLENYIFIHCFIARHCAKPKNEIYLSRLLPLFIRLSSMIIQKFLQLKNEPAKGSQDRIQDDKIIIDSCEKWISKNIQLFFSQLPPPQNKQNRQILLICIGDVTGALMQIGRDGVIDKELINKLLTCFWKYLANNYTWNQVNDVFMRSLLLRKFNNPVHKIEIPELYLPQNVVQPGLNTQAYAYFIKQFLQNGLMQILSQKNLLTILIPTVSEILSRSFEIKKDILNILEKALQKAGKLKIVNGTEYGYPIQLFLFNLNHFESDKFTIFRKYFQFESDQVEINSLAILLSIHIENLIPERNKYIFDTLNKSNVESNRIVLILKKINFKQENPKNQNLLLSLIEKFKHKNQKQALILLNKWKAEGLDAKNIQAITNLLA